MASDAVKVLRDEIARIEKEQQPTRDRIAELQASLAEGQAAIVRNMQAIEILEGTATPAKASAPRAARRNGGIDEASVIAFVQTNPNVGATAIRQHLGLKDKKDGPRLSAKLSQLVEAGRLNAQGERRGRTYSV